ncbi:non-ribosomal peptide synthetase [Actinomadura oligospora]|uniref:non-ribosomal peptide synthetase n=1 Tax=Actinomadura oligospora TaxID=111804 RepID=UPI0004B12695|nr:non-ribosomal peptide synthetase [Actinomadura oligospora]
MSHDDLPQNVGQLLRRAARTSPHAELRYHSAEGGSEYRVSGYPELLDEALHVLTGLRALGLRPRDRVLLLVEEAEAFLPVFWGSVLGGFVPCPLPPVAGDREQATARLRDVHRLLGEPPLVTTEALAAQVEAMSTGMSVTTVEELMRNEPAATVHEPGPGDLALLMLTSGSTGRSKAVKLTHGNLVASMAAKNGHHRLTSSDVALNWVGFDHVAALLECHLLPVSTGSSQVHVPSSVVLDEPLEFTRLISLHGVTMTFTPNFLLGLLNAARPRIRADETIDLSRLRHIISGGEAVPHATGTTFLQAFAPFGLRPDALWPAFGMTETCAGSVYSREFPGVDAGQDFASLGHPVDALEVRITDELDNVLPAGREGELQLRGPMVTTGYFENDTATRAAFTADGWFRTGDVGRLDDGRLTLVGRSKDTIIVNGVNYFSHDIEMALERLDDVASSFVAAFAIRPEGSDTEQLAVAFHPRTEPGDDDALRRVSTEIRRTVVLRWGFRPALVLPLPREAFVKNSLGKISRSTLRTGLEQGEFDAAVRRAAELARRHRGDHEPPRTDTERALAAIYGEVFDIPAEAVSVTANFFDLGGTSLDLLRLRGNVTRRLDAAGLDTVDLLTAPTVRALAAHLDGLATGGAKSDARYDPIVPLQPGGTKTPLFCVHPGAGDVLVLLDLAKQFAGDRPFHAIRTRGLAEGEAAFSNHDEMIDVYTRGIQERQPHGPYALAGYSSGALIAFAVARRLEARGEEVAFLGVFDIPPRLAPIVVGLDFTVSVTVLSHFLGLLDAERTRTLPDAVRDLPWRDQLKAILDLAPPRRIAELDLDLDSFTRWMTLVEHLKKVRAEYEPEGAVRSVSVFHVEQPPPLPAFSHMSPAERADAWHARIHEWDAFAERPVRFHEVPGGHHTFAASPNVRSFAALFQREIDRAMGDGA